MMKGKKNIEVDDRREFVEKREQHLQRRSRLLSEASSSSGTSSERNSLSGSASSLGAVGGPYPPPPSSASAAARKSWLKAGDDDEFDEEDSAKAVKKYCQVNTPMMFSVKSGRTRDFIVSQVLRESSCSNTRHWWMQEAQGINVLPLSSKTQ
ncbi:uncharacterized protein LOC115924623 [Strongylocentrotus purpuratus]|uniref:Uncharacterized protein n=1 Tax=Strongylocentrotus purpuratus TaxID=7668 RepID=A0A7M7SZP2_STRPU|nr:uncharacterized protein LOC115924623 [Strongylocentrotus purpuratus]